MTLRPFELTGADGRRIQGDRAHGSGREVLFITGFLSKRWGNKSRALSQWCAEQGWGFCCYDVRGFGDSQGTFTDYTLSDWIADARSVLSMLMPGPPRQGQPADVGLTIVGNSLGGWIAWLMAQEYEQVDRLILIAPAFNMMGVRARTISAERRHHWRSAGWMPWDDEPPHRDWPLSWKWVEESEAYWSRTFDRIRRVRTSIMHGTEDTVITADGSREFVEQLRRQDPSYPIEYHLVPGDHRLNGPEHMDRLRHLLMEPVRSPC